MNIAIIGLGLIGGSFARAIRSKMKDITLYGLDVNIKSQEAACQDHVIDAYCTPERLATCDWVIFAVKPSLVSVLIHDHSHAFKAGAIIMDVAGTKSSICHRLLAEAEHAPWTFIGAHPMAGKVKGGYASSSATLFVGASILLTPYSSTPQEMVDRLTSYLQPLGFATIRQISPEEHDRRIAYTSQLAHVVSSAYADDPLIEGHDDFSAGSFADMTRIAALDEELWTELFLDNHLALDSVLSPFIDRLIHLRDAIRSQDEPGLKSLLLKGKEMKLTHVSDSPSVPKSAPVVSTPDIPELDLMTIRKEINTIDDALVDLLVKRLNIVQQVIECKRLQGRPVLDPSREREILTHVAQAVGPDLENHARLFFSTLFSICRARQRTALLPEPPLLKTIKAAIEHTPERFPTQAIVACQGTEGAYSQIACDQLFPFPKILYFNTFNDVFNAVEKGFCKYGLLPIENSAAGSVTQVYDLMEQYHFHIIRETRQRINHVLLAQPGVKLEDIREVSSHPHALAQCASFLKNHPSLMPRPVLNTALAAKEIATTPGMSHVAAIASRKCAELYNLDILQENISVTSTNYTRFICISKVPEIYPDAHKITIRFSLPHHPGVLHAILAKFAAIGVNLTKLESRPIPGMDFEFRFSLDLDTTVFNESAMEALVELSQDPDMEHFTFLGCY